MSTIRIEADGASDLSRVLTWMSQHRGEIVQLDESRRLALGVPITGARAVIVAAVLQNDLHPGPQLGGVVRAISNRSDGEPVKLVFEGRSPGGLSDEEAGSVATELLDRLNRRIADEELVAKVA